MGPSNIPFLSFYDYGRKGNFQGSIRRCSHTFLMRSSSTHVRICLHSTYLKFNDIVYIDQLHKKHTHIIYIYTVIYLNITCKMYTQERNFPYFSPSFGVKFLVFSNSLMFFPPTFSSPRPRRRVASPDAPSFESELSHYPGCLIGTLIMVY